MRNGQTKDLLYDGADCPIGLHAMSTPRVPTNAFGVCHIAGVSDLGEHCQTDFLSLSDAERLWPKDDIRVARNELVGWEIVTGPEEDLAYGIDVQLPQLLKCLFTEKVHLPTICLFEHRHPLVYRGDLASGQHPETIER